MTSFSVVQVKRRGWFTDKVVLQADRDISEERQELRASPGSFRLKLLRFRLQGGERIEARIPRSLRGRDTVNLYEIVDCDGLLQRWEVMKSTKGA